MLLLRDPVVEEGTGTGVMVTVSFPGAVEFPDTEETVTKTGLFSYS
jgi:hypothetical protein